MKKLTWRFQKWLNYRCRPMRKVKVRFGELTPQYGTQQVRLSSAVNLPSNLCLDQNADETLSFFLGLRYRTLLHGIRTKPRQKRIAWVRGYTDFLMLLRRLKRTDITAHGFRSTFRDWAAERTAFPNEVVEMALAHAIPHRLRAS
jgi:integrase